MAVDSRMVLPERSKQNASADNVDGSGRVVPGRGPELAAQIHQLREAVSGLPAALAQLGDDALTEVMADLMFLHTRSAQVATWVTRDAVQRGTVAQSDAASTQQWVIGAATAAECVVEPREAHTIAVVAEACRERRNEVLAAAVRDGACTLAVAKTALNAAKKVAPVLPDADRGEILGWYLQLDPALGTSGVDALTRRILATYGPEKLSDEDERLEEGESLSWSRTPTGMLRLVAELSPANAAVLKAAISAGSAPKPSTDGCADHDRHSRDAAEEPGHDCTRDERTPGKRRADALLDLINAGAKALTGKGCPAGGATVLVTMGLAALTAGVGGASSPTGDVLDAGAARRLACNANLIPVVLGGPSEPLDVGREVRLVTGGLRVAVLLRDGGCTFPGCDRPPGFCEVHHVTPWWTGGDTSLINSALLCTRHHHTVHRRGYLATVSSTGVTWHLIPGRMPGHAITAA